MNGKAENDNRGQVTKRAKGVPRCRRREKEGDELGMNATVGGCAIR